MKKIEVTLPFASMVCVLAWLDLSFCLRLLLCITVHELGHLLAMRLWKIPYDRIAVGVGGARIEAVFHGYGRELVCSLAGPLFGILFGLAIAHYMPETAAISMVLSFVNLIPLYPLDGGRMIMAALCMRIDADKAQKVVRTVSAIACSALMILACWAASVLQTGIWPIFASLVLLCRVGRD